MIDTIKARVDDVCHQLIELVAAGRASNPKLSDFRDTHRHYIQARGIEDYTRRQEVVLRRMLGAWVSELTPEIVILHGVGIVGLTATEWVVVNDRRPVWDLLIIKAEDHLGGEHA